MAAPNGHGPQAVPGWYPLPADPNTERYWDGGSWTEHHRPKPAAAPLAITNSGGSGTSKVLLGIVIGIIVVVGSCVASTVMLVDSTVETLEVLSADTIVAGDLPGSVSNPLPLGAAHLRPAGTSGAEWSISVEEVRVLGDQAGDMCIAVVGRATLLDLEDGRAASTAESFPSIDVIDASGISRRPTTLGCDASSVGAEGLLWAQDVELLEGVTIDWYETFLLPEASVQFISVDDTMYSS